MPKEDIAGALIWLICCWGCAGLFFGIGIHACRRKTPLHFWAGTKIDPAKVCDISAYNRENGRMWMLYSVPYWICGMFGFFFGLSQWWSVAALVVMTFACFPGIWLLIREYKRIEKKYIRNA